MDYFDDEPNTIWITAASLHPDAPAAPSAIDFEIFAKQRVEWRQPLPNAGQCIDGVDGGWVVDAGQYCHPKNKAK